MEDFLLTGTVLEYRPLSIQPSVPTVGGFTDVKTGDEQHTIVNVCGKCSRFNPLIRPPRRTVNPTQSLKPVGMVGENDMKKKKLLSLALALIMCLGLTVPAFAASSDDYSANGYTDPP